jgi:hypothetical protein
MEATAADIAAYAAMLVSSVSAVAAWQAMRHAKRQADLADAAVRQAKDSDHSASVLHFTSRFLDLVRGGMRFDDKEWTTQYRGLLHTEFYFFDNGWLPRFMFELWMVDLVNCYRLFPDAWPSHQAHMGLYSVDNDEMVGFFTGLVEIAHRDFIEVPERYAAVRAHVQCHPIYSSRVTE